MTSETDKSNVNQTEPPKINPPLERFNAARFARQKDSDAKNAWKTWHAIAEKHAIEAVRLKGLKDENGARGEYLLAAGADERAYATLVKTQPMSLHSQFSLGETVTSFYIKGGNYEKADQFITGVLARMTPGTDHFQIATGLRSLARRHLNQ